MKRSTKKKIGGLTQALLETAGDMRKSGLLDQAAYEKITLRHLAAGGAPSTIPRDYIKAMAEKASAPKKP